MEPYYIPEDEPLYVVKGIEPMSRRDDPEVNLRLVLENPESKDPEDETVYLHFASRDAAIAVFRQILNYFD